MLDLFLIEIPNFASFDVWMGLLTLTFLEVVLGLDNIIFITLAASDLPNEKRPRIINIGLLLAMVLRILLLFGISYLIAMQNPIWEIHLGWINAEFTAQSLVLFGGGLFLLYKSVDEIDGKLTRSAKSKKSSASNATVTSVLIEISIINIVFSFDSILTAIGLSDYLLIMIIAVVLSVIVMMIFAVPLGKFMNKNPTFQMLGLAFLLLIGFMLIAEGAHLAHLEVADTTVGAIPKGYLYFAIAFSMLVEFLNMKLRKREKPVQLHGAKEEAKKQDILDE